MRANTSSGAGVSPQLVVRDRARCREASSRTRRPTPARRRRSTCPATATGSVAMPRSRSVFLNGTWHVIHDDVPTYRWPSKSAPRPTRSPPTARRACRRSTGSAGRKHRARPRARAGAHRPRAVAGDEVGQLGAVDAGQREQRRRRSRCASRSRLSVSQCRTIESYVAAATPVSLKFNQSFGSRYFHVARATSGLVFLQPQDVRDRILARARRRAAGELDPPAQLARVVALHADRGRRRARGSTPAPRESIQMIASCSAVPSRVDRDRARPLRRDRDRHDRSRRPRRCVATRACAAMQIARHQSAGRCSAPPPGGELDVDRRAVARRRTRRRA